jgi:hypothetical protein
MLKQAPFKRTKQGRHNKLSLGHQSKGIKIFFMDIVIHVVNMVKNLLNIELIKGDIMEDFITP